MRPVLCILLTLIACQSPRRDPGPEAVPARQVVQASPPVREALASLVIRQRTTEDVANTGLDLRIGDITHGEVLVRLIGRLGDDVVAMRPMCVGDSATFRLDGRQQMIALSSMVNRLIGTDYAQFHIGEPETVVRAQIEVILKRVETSKHTFVINGVVCNGEKMARQLRRDYDRHADDIDSGEAFLELVATRPRKGARPYRVRVMPGEGTPLPQWIRGRR